MSFYKKKICGPACGRSTRATERPIWQSRTNNRASTSRRRYALSTAHALNVHSAAALTLESDLSCNKYIIDLTNKISLKITLKFWVRFINSDMQVGKTTCEFSFHVQKVLSWSNYISALFSTDALI